jgi:AraC-like DNA-binding protein
MQPVEPLLTLFSTVIDDPTRLFKAHVVPVVPSMLLRAHAHDDLAQFDLALGCAGEWVVNGRVLPIQGDTAAVFYPYDIHEYRIYPFKPGARLLSIKLRVSSDQACIGDRWFAEYRPRLGNVQSLVRAIERLVRLSEPSASVAMRLVRLQEVLCLWPANDETASGGRHPSAFDDEAVEQAMGYIQTHLNRRVDLTEMADYVNLSPRHLSRRFHNATGLSPRAWAERQRIALAQDLLDRPDVLVKQVAQSMGFDSVQTFSRWFRRESGRTPSDARGTH